MRARHRKWRQLGRWWSLQPPLTQGLVLLVGFLTAANIEMFAFSEQRGGYYFKALNAREHGDVIHDAWFSDENSRSRYSPYLALSYLSPGSTVVVCEQGSADVPKDKAGPPDIVWIAERIYEFGGAAQVVSRPGSARDRLGDLDYATNIVATGRAGFRGAAWQIAIAHPEDVPGVPSQYLSRAMFGEDVPHVPPKTFLLVLVPLDDPKDLWGYRRVLIDEALLAPGEGCS